MDYPAPSISKNPLSQGSVPEPAMGTTTSPSIIRLKPLPLRNLPKIDAGSALIADHDLVFPAEIVPGVLHAGTKAVLAASSKVGKSWMLLSLSAGVATGTPFLKWNTTPGKVLFVNFEIHRAFIKKRLQIIQERMHLDNLDNLHVWTLRGASVDPEELLESIIAEARADRYALIILDPIYKLMVGRSENMAVGLGRSATTSSDWWKRPARRWCMRIISPRATRRRRPPLTG